MKKFRAALVLFPALFLSIVFFPAAASVWAGSYDYTLESGPYKITSLADGSQEIIMEGFGQLLHPGKPKLPSKIFNIALPPGSTITDVRVELATAQPLDGSWKITPAGMESLLNAAPDDIAQQKIQYNQIVSTAYASNAPYPLKPAVFIQGGGYRKYRVAQVRFSPFQYIAATQTLIHYPSVKIVIAYETEAVGSIPEHAAALSALSAGGNSTSTGLSSRETEEQAARIIENTDQAQEWYAPSDQDTRYAAAEADAAGPYEFVIITTEALTDAVQPLASWERSKGRAVYVATTDEIQEVYPSLDLPRAIRYWLRVRYPSDQWGITSVCLVGDLMDLPMRYTDPNQTGNLIPTDYYYAELSELDHDSWDYDNDGHFAEQGEDRIDFIPEVTVGRIPWSNPDTVAAICRKIAGYEYSSNMQGYKRNVLFNAAFFWYHTDGAELSEYLLNQTASFDGWTPYLIYERSDASVDPLEARRWSTYPADDYMTMTASPFVDEWAFSATRYGFVNWMGHGSPYGAVYHAGDDLDAINFIYRSDALNLDDDYPAIVFSDSCSTAYPDDASLGRYIMRQGGVAFVGANRASLGTYGWDDPSDGHSATFHYEFARRVAGFSGYTVGQCFRYALYNMYHTWNWTNHWDMMLEWTLFGNPDMLASSECPPLSNLITDTPAGWDDPIVPRDITGTTFDSCPLTDTLPGNSSDTYFNWAYRNNGSIMTPASRARLYLDEKQIAETSFSLAAGVGSYQSNRKYDAYIRGGRHTLYDRLDDDETVWETDESDNCWGRQFVWSPFFLEDDTPVHFSAAPHADAWGCTSGFYNNDGYAFDVAPASPDKWWSAVGVLAAGPESDYDLRLWDIGNYTGSEQGFGSGYLEWSGNGGSASDFIIINARNADIGTYTAGAINRNNTDRNYHIGEATSTRINFGENGPYEFSSTAVVKIFEIWIPQPGEYGFLLEQQIGTLDLGISLYDDATITASKSDHMADGYANAGGDGEGEFMQVSIPDPGYHALVVWKVDDSDYPKAGTYALKTGECMVPEAPSGPSPTDGETSISVTADLDWMDCDNTEYYEIYLDDGSGWSLLGTSQSSFWEPVQDFEPATVYQWRIVAHNLCGTTNEMVWQFTTRDTVPPDPNPMTWALAPYEAGTSALVMEAAAAADISEPVTYSFEFVDSPTGGNGGSSSGDIITPLFSDTRLEPNHQYGYQVSARDNAGNTTTASPVSYAYTAIEPSEGIVFVDISPGSIQVRSKNIPSNMTSGRSGIYFSNDTDRTVSGWIQELFTPNPTWVSTGLKPNTRYSFRALTRNGDGAESTWSDVFSRCTLAQVPAAEAFSNISAHQVQVNWSSNGNPLKTTAYECSNLTTGGSSGWIQDLSWAFDNLKPDTAYEFQVRARNTDGIETDWVFLGNVSTFPLPCPGDFDGNRKIDNKDLGVFAADFGRNACGSAGCRPDIQSGDTLPDQDVDGADLYIFTKELDRGVCP